MEQPQFDPNRITEALAPLDGKVLEPLVRKAADEFYGYVIDAIRDYLIDNLDFNLKSHVAMLERENQRMRTELHEADQALSGRWNTPETRLAAIDSLKRAVLAKAKAA